MWRAGPELLKVYGDLGLTALLLGANGLPAGGEGAHPPDRRSQYLVCVAERDLKVLLPLLPGLDVKGGRRTDAPVVAVAE